MVDKIQSEEDNIPVSTFVKKENNKSLYYSKDDGNITSSLYNPKDTAVKDFRYDVALPVEGDTNGPDGESSAWTAKLTKALDVSHIP